MRRVRTLLLVLVMGVSVLSLPVVSECSEIKGFEHHLDGAIFLNTERMAIYHLLTGGKSDQLFIGLIGMEKELLPLARTIDTRAVPFNEQGVPIIVNDFVPMENVNAFYVPPKYTGKWKSTSCTFRQASTIFSLSTSSIRGGRTIFRAAAEVMRSNGERGGLLFGLDERRSGSPPGRRPGVTVENREGGRFTRPPYVKS
jgi:hypothetical protein